MQQLSIRTKHFTAICVYTKLVPPWLVGERSIDDAAFMRDLRGRLADPRVQIRTDGLAVYKEGVFEAFGEDIDFAQLHKVFGTDPRLSGQERGYSSARYTGLRQGRLR